jgi:hypothetical protein
MAALQPAKISAAVVPRTTACPMLFAVMRSLWCGSATQTLDRHSRPRRWQSVMISKFRERRSAVGNKPFQIINATCSLQNIERSMAVDPTSPHYEVYFCRDGNIFEGISRHGNNVS